MSYTSTLKKIVFDSENNRQLGKSLSINNVSKSYGTNTVLNNICLDICAGEFVTILGASGCGKTTLLKIIAGFETSQEGAIFIEGKNILKSKPYMRNIGVLFQNYALFPHLNVRENIAYPLHVRRLTKNKINERVSEIIEMVKLAGMEDRYPHQLSGGQQQRVALARAVVYNPPLLLLDEPFSALDVKLRYDMQVEIKQIQKKLGITTISVTHDQDEAMTMSDRICIMKDGIIQQYDTAEAIYSYPQNSFVANFMGSVNMFKCRVLDCKQFSDTYTYYLKSELCEFEYIIESNQKYHDYDDGLEECLLVIRPEHLSVEKSQMDLSLNRLSAIVERTMYLGDRIRVDLSCGEGLPLLMKVPSMRSEHFKVGSKIDLTFSRQAPYLIFEKNTKEK